MKRIVLRYFLSPFFTAYWRILKPKTFGVKCLILSSARPREVLMVRHTYGNTKKWHLPGGGYNPKRETSNNAAQREVYEELGINIKSTNYLGQYKTSAQGKRDTVDIFLCYANSSTFKKNSEISEARWVGFDEIQENDNFTPITHYALMLLEKSK